MRDHSVNEDRKKNRLSIHTNREQEADSNEVIASRMVNMSKSPDKYLVGNSLVVDLNDP